MNSTNTVIANGRTSKEVIKNLLKITKLDGKFGHGNQVTPEGILKLQKTIHSVIE